MLHQLAAGFQWVKVSSTSNPVISRGMSGIRGWDLFSVVSKMFVQYKEHSCRHWSLREFNQSSWELSAVGHRPSFYLCTAHFDKGHVLNPFYWISCLKHQSTIWKFTAVEHWKNRNVRIFLIFRFTAGNDQTGSHFPYSSEWVINSMFGLSLWYFVQYHWTQSNCSDLGWERNFMVTLRLQRRWKVWK